MVSLAGVVVVMGVVAMANGPLKYPETHKSEVVDDYFGTKVPDPYRWLEDDNAPETKAWVEAQNKITFAFLETIPERQAITARLTKLWNFEKYAPPVQRGKRYFYTFNSGLQNQAALYVAESLSQPGRILLDPNTLSKDGTVALSGVAITQDGSLLAYALSQAGSDWQTWKVLDVASGVNRADEIRWSKFSRASWLPDNSGFFYSAYEPPEQEQSLTAVNKWQKLFWHRLGTPQSQDQLVFERQDQPEWGFDGEVTEDGRWLVITQWQGTEPNNRVFLKDLKKPHSQVEPLLDRFDASYVVVDAEGETFFVHTDQAAPRKRLVAIRRGQPEPRQWSELIPQGAGTDVLDQVAVAQNRFIAVWMRDARSVVTVHRLDGQKVRELTLPAIGTVANVVGRRQDREAFYTFQSFTYPPAVFRLKPRRVSATVWRAPQVDMDSSAFQVSQVFYSSRDGTRIPMFVAHREGLALDGNNPTLLYGYGGFNASETPAFSVSRLVWMERGGVLAVPNLRGGGEYGKAWHDAGRLEHKQNVFDDFIAAAEWLIAQKYTTSSKIGINGGSNGGLLVGACLTQRPDLFGAAVPEVGVLDMLRYHKFTIGWAWKSDYLVSDSKEGFAGLIKYSPLHNLRPHVQYPATLVTTGDHDDRVVPAHSHKFIATLQACQAGPAPVLTRIETDAGHGAGKPTAKVIAERADVLSFLSHALGLATR